MWAWTYGPASAQAPAKSHRYGEASHETTILLCLSLVLTLGLQASTAAAESAPGDVPTVEELLTEQGVGHLQLHSAAKAGETVESRTISIVERDAELSAEDLELAEEFGSAIDTSEVLVVELDESGPLTGSPGGTLATASLDGTAMQMASSSTCRWVARTRSYTYLGITRYRYQLRSEWCHNGTRIVGTPFTFATPSTWASWAQTGETVTRGWHGSGNTRVYRTHAVGRFKNVVSNYSRQPWIHTEVRRNGTHVHSSGG